MRSDFAAAVDVRVVEQGVAGFVGGDDRPPSRSPARGGDLGRIPGPRHPPATIGQAAGPQQTDSYWNGLHNPSNFWPELKSAPRRAQSEIRENDPRQIAVMLAPCALRVSRPALQLDQPATKNAERMASNPGVDIKVLSRDYYGNI